MSGIGAVDIIWPTSIRSSLAPAISQIGVKARNLLLVPDSWCPPFFILTSNTNLIWKRAGGALRDDITSAAAQEICNCAKTFETRWDAGLILRSSAVEETMLDRGTFSSVSISADYNVRQIASAIEEIFSNALDRGSDALLALLVQPYVPGPRRYLGHLSNERRVSKTINQWMVESPDLSWLDRFNSQRTQIADVSAPLLASNEGKIVSQFRAVARWSTELRKGPCHIEWAWAAGYLWLLQIDFEDESPDDGVDPRKLLRATDFQPISPQNISILTKVNFAQESGWPKIDKTRELSEIRTDPYPPLYFVKSSDISKNTELVREISEISNGRVVCRTDCVSEDIPKLNLPRTHSVSPQSALDFMHKTKKQIVQDGASPEEICFVLHRFIASTSAAWVLVDPTSQIVRVDSLWGIPDGLQYLPHDTFEFDIKRGEVSAETLRYKSSYLQETANGEWREIKVARRFGRSRTLSSSAVREVALTSYEIAKRLKKKILVMWFCGIPDQLGIGANLPWFRMASTDGATDSARSVAPTILRFAVRNRDDLERARNTISGARVLAIQPDAELFRDDNFLRELIDVANKQGFAVELRGSVLAHAFYILQRAGLTVIAAGELQHTRTRGKKVFAKLVRDEIPEQIERHGERTVSARLPKHESRIALAAKVFEETFELLAARSPSDVEAELADLLEVVRGLASVTGARWEDVLAKAEHKRRQRGGFDGGVVLLETAWPKSGGVEHGLQSPISIVELAKAVSGVDQSSYNFLALLQSAKQTRTFLAEGVRYELNLTADGLTICRVQRVQEEKQLNLPGFETE